MTRATPVSHPLALLGAGSRRGRVLMAVAVIVLVLVCLGQAAFAREQGAFERFAQERFSQERFSQERFAQERFAQQAAGLPADAVARLDKTRRYLDAGLRDFASDGTLQTPDAVFFTPSPNDLLGVVGNGEARGAHRTDRTNPHAVSVSDPGRLLGPAHSCDGLAPMALQAPREQDATIHMWGGRYLFAKACLRAPFSVAGDTAITLDNRAYGTRVLVLTRPVLLAGGSSRFYAPQRVRSGGLVLRDYDSARPGRYTLPVKAVTDPVLQHPMHTRPLRDGAGAGALLMFYPRYQAPVGSVRAPTHDVLTLYLPQSEASPTSVSVAGAFSVRSQAHPGTGERVVGVQTSTGDVSSGQWVPAPPGSLVVFTYVHNLVILASLSPQRVALKEFGGQAPLSLQPAAFQAAAALGPPPRPWGVPYDNACVPNLADLAIKAGLLSATATTGLAQHATHLLQTRLSDGHSQQLHQQCLQPAGGAKAAGKAGARVQAAGCDRGSPAQHFAHNKQLQLVVKPAGGPGGQPMCLDVWHAAAKPGQPVVQWPCHKPGSVGANQRWKWDDHGRVRSQLGGKGLCLDVDRGRVGGGAVVWPCHNGANQKFARV